MQFNNSSNLVAILPFGNKSNRTPSKAIKSISHSLLTNDLPKMLLITEGLKMNSKKINIDQNAYFIEDILEKKRKEVSIVRTKNVKNWESVPLGISIDNRIGSFKCETNEGVKILLIVLHAPYKTTNKEDNLKNFLSAISDKMRLDEYDLVIFGGDHNCQECYFKELMEDSSYFPSVFEKRIFTKRVMFCAVLHNPNSFEYLTLKELEPEDLQLKSEDVEDLEHKPIFIKLTYVKN